MREMKNSGIEWIGDIPSDWEYCKLKSYFDFEKGKNAALYTQEYIGEHIGEFPVYSGQTENDGVMGTIDSYDYDIEKCLFTTTVGAKVMTPKILKGKFSLSQNCLIMRVKKVCSIDFFYYSLLPLFSYKKSLIPSYMQPSLRIEDLRTYGLFTPDILIQKKIADFLDKKCAWIDTVIEKTKATIEEYKKLKQSVITQAVTKGIRPNRQMKDSGVDWLGSLPENWSVSRIKYISDFEPFCDLSKLENESIVTYTPMECIKNGYFINRTEIFSKISSSLVSYQEGDIVMAKVTPCFENGNISIMNGLSSGVGMGSSELYVFRPTKINEKFLFYWLRSEPFKNKACSTMTGTGGLKRVSAYFVKNSEIFVPSDNEQKEIADYLDKKCSEIDELIAKKTALLSELESYKKSLIYEYVTGKKEV